MTTNPDDLAAKVDRLADAVADLAVAHREEADATVEAMRRRTRLERIVFASLVVVLVGVAATCWGVWAVHSTQHTQAQASARGRETLAVIKDCTDPAGACAQRGQQQTAAAVAAISSSQIVASWCALHSPTLKAAQACVASSP